MKRKVRGSISDSSHASRARAVDERGLSSIIDMKPSASFAPMVSITLSPITMSMTPDCTIYMQSGVIDMVIGETVIETIGANEALGFMSMIDDLPRSSTAKAREACELSLIDARTFRFMVDEVPNFATYIMGVLARRIRGMGKAM